MFVVCWGWTRWNGGIEFGELGERMGFRRLKASVLERRRRFRRFGVKVAYCGGNLRKVYQVEQWSLQGLQVVAEFEVEIDVGY